MNDERRCFLIVTNHQGCVRWRLVFENSLHDIGRGGAFISQPTTSQNIIFEIVLSRHEGICRGTRGRRGFLGHLKRTHYVKVGLSMVAKKEECQ